MNPTEMLALQHLRARGFEDVVHEPDGQCPPDFLVDGRVAIEVRRLNQHERHCDSPKGLEESSIPYRQRLAKLLATCTATAPGTHWVGLRFQRPLPPWRETQRGARTFLSELNAGAMPTGTEVEIAPGLDLEYLHHTPEGPGRFEIGTVLDFDLGGMVLSEFERNLRLCSEDKIRKVDRVRSRYPEWWLLLVDTVGYGLLDRDRTQYADSFEAPAGWDKIVIVSPLNPERYFDI